MKRLCRYLLLPALALNVAGSAFADRPHPPVSPGSRCAAQKIEANGEYMEDLLECRAQTWTDAKATGRGCESKAKQQLAARYAKAESAARGACKTTGDVAAVASRIDTSAAALEATLRETNPSPCAKRKLSSIGEAAEDQHVCYAAAEAKGAGFSVDPACQDTATARFLAAFARTAPLPGCVAGTLDAPALDQQIRLAAFGSQAAVAPPVSECAPIEVTTVHGQSFQGHSRLVKIENGQVPCVHGEDGTVASCAFITVAPPSGEWLDSPDGQFALVGQSLSRAGLPGGEYIVAARVSDAAPAPCVELPSMDSAALIPPGTDLYARCVVEEMNQEWNALSAYGYAPIVNYSDLVVCSANDPATGHAHPDNSYYVGDGGYGPGHGCYTAWGAALNDINGAERDATGSYYLDEEHCHLLQVNGVEIPAAKRPATRSIPAPGSVNVNSYVSWRPVNPNLNIANAYDPNQEKPPVTYENKLAFIGDTQAVNASGPLPNLGQAGLRETVGSVTLSLPAGGDNFFIGANGSGVEDWTDLLPGNDIALGYEVLQVQTAQPVYALGFEFVEPNTTLPDWGGTPVDSPYSVVLYAGATEVGRFTFNAPDDVAAFVGVKNDRPFDRVIITDTTGDQDNEYFGQFYTGSTP